MKTILITTCTFLLVAASAFGQDKLKIDLKGTNEPDVYIDGRKYDYAIVDLLDQSKIKSVDVIKGEKAKDDYNAPNGVVLIKTKEGTDESFKIDGKKTKVEIRSAEVKDPIIIIDGKISEQESLSKLSPDDIMSIEVLKGDKAIEEHNAPNGVIIVKTNN